MRPIINWKIRIGSIQSRNTIAYRDGVVFVGTCGDTWNRRDSKDGVHAIDASSGAVRWSVYTTSDVNEIALGDKIVVAPTDAGDLFVIDRDSGRVISIHRLDSAVVSKPLISEHFGRWTIIIVSIAGFVYLIDSSDEACVCLGKVNAGVRANLIPIRPETNTEFLAFTEDGGIISCSLSQGSLSTHFLGAVEYVGYNESTYAIDTKKRGRISAPPKFDGTHLIGGFARETEFDSAPAYCFNLAEQRFDWITPKMPEGLGNCRVTPCFVGDKTAFSFAYTSGVHILDTATGDLAGFVRLGQTVFQQWAGPAVFSGSLILVGRVDGVLSLVDIEKLTLVASLSLATAETEQFSRRPVYPDEDSDTFQLFPGEPPRGGVCGTPVVHGRQVFVGTTTGDLFCVSFLP